MELDRAALRESLEDLFENAPCGYLTALADGTLTQVNETFLAWTGYSRELLVSGMRFKELLSRPGKIYYETHIAPLLATRFFVQEVAFELIRPNRSNLPVLLNGVLRQDARPGESALRITVFAASERRQYEQDLLRARRSAEQATLAERAAREQSERANRTKDQFFALVSHELRTPLGAILGWAQVLQKRHADNSELLHGLDVIERNTRLQVRLVDDLMDTSRILSGKVHLEVQRVNLAEVIDAALETARPSAATREVRLQTILDSTVAVSGDSGRLQQIFWNLLSNAVKFTENGGFVRVVMERVNSHIEVSVTDSGQGMSAEFLTRAFERFRQAAGATPQGGCGLGLGLSIVKTLVEMHGGSIEAHSPGEGHGSTFVVKLPIAAVHGAAESNRADAEAVLAGGTFERVPINLSGVRVLIVDDAAEAREVLSRVLRDCGAEVTAVGVAAKALAAIDSIHPHVLISDIGLPGEDGYELIRKVRLLGAGGLTPAVALTAFARLEDRTRAMLSGFQMHLSKPVDAHELIVTVASLAGRIPAQGSVPR